MTQIPIAVVTVGNKKKWYFVSKIVLASCEKKVFLWSRKTLEIRAECFLTCSLRFNLEELKLNLENQLVFRNLQENLEKVVPCKFSKYPKDKYVGMSINKHNTTLKIGFRSLNFFFCKRTIRFRSISQFQIENSNLRNKTLALFQIYCRVSSAKIYLYVSQY